MADHDPGHASDHTPDHAPAQTADGAEAEAAAPDLTSPSDPPRPPHRPTTHARPRTSASATSAASALGGALGGSIEGIGDVADSAWQGLKTVGEFWHSSARPHTVSVPAADDPAAAWTRELATVLCQVGAEMLRSGSSSTDVEAAVSDMAARYGMHARSFAVPSGLFVRVGAGPQGVGGELDFASVEPGDLRLDQVQVLQDLVKRMRREAVPFAEVLSALKHEQTMPQRFQPAAVVGGYTLLTVGLGMMQHAALNAALGYTVLGAAVGLLRLVGDRYLPRLQVLLPVVAAVLVTALAQRFAGPVLHEQAANLFVAPLIGFLPGAALTMGAIELATQGTLAGVARLAGAANVLLLLALGILVGTEAVPLRPIPPGDHHVYQFGSWAAWCGVLLLAFGFTLYYSAPARTLSWLTGALLVERAAQTAGTRLGSAALGAFAAGMLLPPLAGWIARRSDIPDQVVFLPCFWLLVPGASGLSGVSDLFVNHDTASLATLLNTVITVAAIALGILAGASFLRQTRIRVAPPEPATAAAAAAAAAAADAPAGAAEAAGD